MPPERTSTIGWHREPSFSQKYARAREQQIEHFVDEIVEIADAVAGSTDAAIVNAARLAIDTRKWAAAKRLPRKYGDKLDIESAGNFVIKIVHGLGEPGPTRSEQGSDLKLPVEK